MATRFLQNKRLSNGELQQALECLAICSKKIYFVIS